MIRSLTIAAITLCAAPLLSGCVLAVAGGAVAGVSAARQERSVGNALDDDIVDISLGAIWGNTLSALKLVPDDHKEAPCLTTDNVAYDKSNTKTFPYIQAPL